MTCTDKITSNLSLVFAGSARFMRCMPSYTHVQCTCIYSLHLAFPHQCSILHFRTPRLLTALHTDSLVHECTSEQKLFTAWCYIYSVNAFALLLQALGNALHSLTMTYPCESRSLATDFSKPPEEHLYIRVRSKSRPCLLMLGHGGRAAAYRPNSCT